MNRIVLSLALGLLATTTLASCHWTVYSPQGNGEATSSADAEQQASEASSSSTDQGGTRQIGQIGNFRSLSVSNGIEVKYNKAGQRSISVTTTHIAPSQVAFHVREGELNIDYVYGERPRKSKVVVTITGYEINDFELNNGGVIEIAAGHQQRGKLELEVNNGGSVKVGHGLRLNGALKIEVNNGGAIALNDAKVSSLDASVNNGGSIALNQLQAGSVEADIENGGSIEMSGQATAAKLEVEQGGNISASQLAVQRAEVKVENGGVINYNAQRVTRQNVENGGIARNHRR